MVVTKKIDPASAKTKTAPKEVKKPAVKKQTLRGKGLKKKKEHLRFGVDCTNIAEDNILDVSDFVSFYSFWSFYSLLINCVISGKILEGTLQGQRQDRKFGQQCFPRTSKDEGLRQLRCSLLKTLFEVFDKEILEEAQSS